MTHHMAPLLWGARSGRQKILPWLVHTLPTRQTFSVFLRIHGASNDSFKEYLKLSSVSVSIQWPSNLMQQRTAMNSHIVALFGCDKIPQPKATERRWAYFSSQFQVVHSPPQWRKHVSRGMRPAWQSGSRETTFDPHTGSRDYIWSSHRKQRDHIWLLHRKQRERTGRVRIYYLKAHSQWCTSSW